MWVRRGKKERLFGQKEVNGFWELETRGRVKLLKRGFVRYLKGIIGRGVWMGRDCWNSGSCHS